MSEPKSREGTQFGPYRLLRLIGKGGMGEVYEAEDTVKDRIVALKLLPESASHDPVFRKRLQREAHSAGRLQEPHVVPIHDYGEIDGVLYVDMRMINGSDLRKILKNFGPMTPARAVAIVRQIASALDAAHEGGVMHRDVKPENILINRDDFAYLVDFGIANAASDEKLTELGTAVGTYAYMAPERFTSGVVTYRADIYALACVLHECLTGSQPYGGDSVSVVITAHLMQPIPRPSAERPGVPAAFDQVIARGMAKKADERYASAGDLAMAATAALTVRDQDQAETILQRGEAATLPSKRFDPATIAAPPPGGRPPFGATPPP
ncbi:MAG TPA: serine/threonine-protein kinase, partial [Mycobacterium sp.]